MNTSLSRLRSFYGEFRPPLLLHAMIRREFPGSVALLTSFGRDAGILLSVVAEIDPALPVLFFNTGTHSAETLDYAHSLSNHLCLTHMRVLPPMPHKNPGKGELGQMLESLGLLALITGRTQSGIDTIELDENGVFRINPLAGWTKEEQNGEMNRRTIPLHPLDGSAHDEQQGWSYLNRKQDTGPSLGKPTDAGNWSV